MFVFASCNKDQSAVKKLDGSWQLSKINGNNVEADEVTKITFTKCKLKKEETCAVKFEYTSFGETEEFAGEFLVADKGETLELRFTFFGQTNIERFTIKELSKETLVLEITEGTSVQTEEYKKL